MKRQKSLAVNKAIRGNVFPVVGIGASAGGLNAFSAFLKAVHPTSNAAFVFVQHLDPKKKSLLPSLLSRVTDIPLTEVTTTTQIQANHIYIMPSGNDMIIKNGNNNTLYLVRRRNHVHLHKPIDKFFRSLATAKKHLAVGVVLSGTGSDGTEGLRAIKEWGGATFVQDASAEHEGMPESALAAKVVDFVLPPAKIADRINQMATRASDNDSMLTSILALLKKKTSIDFSEYKSTTVQRRIQRRMLFSGITTLEAYHTLLTKNPVELDTLGKDMLIHVTSFFRDDEQLHALKKMLFPALLKNRKKGSKKPIKVWVPGCATGEEVYSLAMLLHEFLDAKRIPFRILGSDISRDAILRAREGAYERNIEEHISKKRLKRFFTTSKNGYQVKKLLKATCTFLLHNVTDAPPIAQVDLISCRNVLIYLGPALQQKALSKLSAALVPRGFLMLGKSEGIGNSRLFQALASQYKLYTNVALLSATMKPHVAFQKRNSSDRSTIARDKRSTPRTPPNRALPNDRQKRISKLREALLLTHEYSDTVIGELDVMNKELQSSNEGHATANEELQTTNEELETTQEELRASNEEMKTLNEELEVRNEEITVTRDYAEAILKTARVPIVILGGNLKLKSANAAFYTTFKTSEAETENKILYDLGNRQWAIPRLRELLEKILPTKGTMTDFIVEHKFETIGQKTMLLNATTLKQGPDTEPHILLSIEDITARKKAEELLELALEHRDDFISIASHELKTPVTSIKAYAQILERRFQKAGDLQSAELVQKMDVQLGKLTGLISDLLDVTKIESGKLQFREESFDFKKLVEEIVDEIRLTTVHRIVTTLARTGNVFGDRDRIGQVISNLLTNAIKYSPHTKSIVVKTTADAQKLTLSVQDFGIGLAHDVQAKIFERFYRIEGRGQETYPGLGLGLYIASEIVKRQHGTIGVKSTKGRGSTFFVTLPVQKRSAPKKA